MWCFERYVIVKYWSLCVTTLIRLLFLKFTQLVSKFILPLIIFRWKLLSNNLINMTVSILGSNMLCFKAWLLNAYKERPCSSFLELGRVLVLNCSVESRPKWPNLDIKLPFSGQIQATFLWANYHYGIYYILWPSKAGYIVGVILYCVNWW